MLEGFGKVDRLAQERVKSGGIETSQCELPAEAHAGILLHRCEPAVGRALGGVEMVEVQKKSSRGTGIVEIEARDLDKHHEKRVIQGMGANANGEVFKRHLERVRRVTLDWHTDQIGECREN